MHDVCSACELRYCMLYASCCCMHDTGHACVVAGHLQVVIILTESDMNYNAQLVHVPIS